MNEKYAHWIPAVSCAAFAVLCVVGGFAADFMNSASSPGRQIDFPSMIFSLSLPMCFYHVATITRRLHCENRELREQVAALRLSAPQLEEVA